MTARYTLLAGAALLGLAALPTASMAQQPLPVSVNPFYYGQQAVGFAGQVATLPLTIAAAPFRALAGAPDRYNTEYNPAPAKAAAVGYVDGIYAEVPAGVLKQTGPQYINPQNGQPPVIIAQGTGVPGFVKTQKMKNITVAGLQPGGDYEYFIAPSGKTVVVEPGSRRVVRILR